MRIGLIAPPWVCIPPVGYGGTEAVVDNLARGLVQRGHQVHLFTVGTSTCPVHRDWLYPQPAPVMGTSVEEAAHVLAAYDAYADLDIIHDHTVLGPLVGARTGRLHAPVVITQHGLFDDDNRRIFAEISRYASVVAISHDQRSHATGVRIVDVIHHGIDLNAYRPGPGGENLVFLGRMSPKKGVHLAVRIAHAAGRPLTVMSKMREPAERAYFDEVVEPLLRPDDEVLFEPPHPVISRILQHAAALINPITWPEPFGLVMAEALACGTPVLAYGRGAAPEIVDSGTTGFLCESEEELVRAVARIPELDRHACRDAAERRFSLHRMAADHEALYQRVLLEQDADAGPARETALR